MVCYSFKLPADATSGSACNITALSFSVTGDRYLDRGADVFVVYSSDLAPVDPVSFLDGSYTSPRVATGLCRTDDQPETPNNRHGVTAQVSLAPSRAATAYIHVVIRLTDYLATRGAWIEGGAMLDSAAISVTFSRNVTPDATSDTPYIVPGYWASLFRADFANDQNAANEGPSIAAFRDQYWYATYGTNGMPTRDNDLSQLIAALRDKRLLQRSSSVVCSAGAADPTAILVDAGAYKVQTGTVSESAYYLAACGVAFMSPVRKIKGLTFSFSIVNNQLANSPIRFGIVQGDVAPTPSGTVQTFTDPSDNTIDGMVPWRELLNGSGNNLIGFRDRSEDTSATGTLTFSVPITREPTKRFLWLCLCPMPNAQLSGKFGMPTAPTVWRFDSDVIT